MFGYVTTYRPSLRVREDEYYRAQYCGLCHAMGKCTGCLSRMTLSYDMAFFSLLKGSLMGESVSFEKKRCIRHPLKKRLTVCFGHDLEFSAYASAILTYHKIRDNVSDEKGIKRLGARSCSALFRKMKKRGVESLPQVDSYVGEKLEELHTVEEARVRSVDIPADIFGDIISYMLSYGFEGKERIVAEKIGQRLGRWIYMTDALDDYERDRSDGNYNPFVLLYDGKDFTEEELTSISYMLCGELDYAANAFDLVDDENTDRVEIIKNILHIGMPEAAKKILQKKNGERQK